MAIFADTLAEIYREAERLKREHPHNRKPSAAKVLDLAWVAYKASLNGTSIIPQLDDKLIPTSMSGDVKWRKAYLQLDAIFRSGDKEVQKAIVSNLAVFSRITGVNIDGEGSPVFEARTGNLVKRSKAAIINADAALGAKNPVVEKSEGDRGASPRNKPGDPGKGKKTNGRGRDRKVKPREKAG